MAGELRVTPELYRRLKARYKQAVDAGEDSFTLDGHEFLTNYAKYLLEYLAPKFGDKA
jgi:hypothetical protein